MHKHLPPRWDAKDAWDFVTVVTRERHPHFASEAACGILMDACRAVRARHPYRLGALVILPDHWHAVMQPRTNEVIESIVGSIKQRVFHASRTCGDAPVLWQPRFMDHRIRSEPDYHQHVEYMRLNPLKHQYVQNQEDPWPWVFVHPNPFA